MSTVWIPGWQFAGSAFDRLRSLLGESDSVCLEYSGTSMSWDRWCDEQAARLPAGVRLIGWSLGGMLACELARRCEQPTEVVVLQANTRFSGGPGLPEAVAEGFRQRYSRQPGATRGKFTALVDPDGQADLTPHLLSSNEAQWLDWLYDIDLQNTEIPASVRVLLSRDDQLVPCTSASESWRHAGHHVDIIDGSHSLIMSQPQRVADWIESHE